ncbi:sugar O-acetyltransferase [soil metagenome]
MKARMLAGEEYMATDPQLVEERLHCIELLERFHALAGRDEPGRLAVLRELFGAVGEETLIQPPFRCDYGYNIRIGRRSFVNYGGVFLDVNPITIGDEVLIAANVQLLTATHPLDAKRRRAWWEYARPISIADGAWIGGGAIVLPGISIGRDAIVGAGAVVTRDVEPGTVVAGNPARVIRRL